MRLSNRTSLLGEDRGWTTKINENNSKEVGLLGLYIYMINKKVDHLQLSQWDKVTKN